MKNAMVSGRYRLSFVQRSLALAAVAFGLSAVGCQEGSEGDRCNPDLSHNDCNSGLTCQQPLPCVENYCCPPDLSSSSSPYCRGDLAVCPAPDAAEPTGDAGDGGAADGGSEAGGDASSDSGLDSTLASSPDAGGDSGAVVDAGSDAPFDATSDSSVDSASDGDASGDTGGDAAADASGDALASG